MEPIQLRNRNQVWECLLNSGLPFEMISHVLIEYKIPVKGFFCMYICIPWFLK